MADTNPSEFTVMTNAAVNLAAQALAGTSKIKFTKVIGSSAVHFSDNPESIAQLTDLAPNNQTGIIKYASKEGTNQSIVQADFDELNVSADYDLATIGLYASGDDGNEILYAVVCLQFPDHMIAGNSDTSSYYIRVVVGNTANLDVTVSPTGTVSNAQLESVLADYVKTTDLQKLIDTSDYAKLKEDNEFKGNNKFDIDPTDSAGNAYAKTVDVNQQLDKKVTDNKDGTEQLNGVQVQPFNKLSDRVGGRNYLINTQNPSATNPVKFLDVTKTDTSGTVTFSNGYVKVTSIVSSTASEAYYRFILPTPTVMPLPSGTYTLAVDLTSSDNVHVVPRLEYSTDGTSAWKDLVYPTWYLSSTEQRYYYTFTIPLNATGWYISLEMFASDGSRDNTGKSFQFRNASIQKGNIASDSSPAPEDKVNVSDMRKPANDVAGIEEVNAKQDKIGYTPADDSKVVHTAAPGIPKLAVNYNATSKAFDYTLTAPEKDGFSDIIQYNLLWKDHSVDDWTTVIVKPDALTGQLTGVDITKTYDFKVAAQNAVGSSGYTDVITLVAAVVPGIPSLTVKYNAGKKGFDYTVTAPESDGGSEITGYSLEYQKQGGTDWTKVALKPDSLTGTVTDGIEAGNDYLFRVNVENAAGSSDYFTVSDPLPTVDGNIYGVSWDGSSSGALQRTDAAVGLKAGINGAQNDFDTRGPWGLMDKTITDSYGNAFVRVPKFYIRKTQNKPLSTWQVSLVKQGDDWYLPNCFYDFDNNKELDYVDVSRYEGSIASGKLQSKTGATPTNNQTIVQLRSSAVANNTDGKKGYHLWDVHTLDALQVLFTIEFATLDSQSIMKGNTDNTGNYLANNGATDNVKGSSGFVTSGATPMTYRGIENLYGNLAMWTDGLNISNLSLYSCDDATKYASDVFTSPYYKLNYSLYSSSGNSNITGLGFDKDHPSVEAPTSFNNDQYNTYYHDYGYVYSGGNYVVYTGGGWSWIAGFSGLWSWGGSDSSTGADSDVGSRLLKKAL